MPAKVGALKVGDVADKLAPLKDATCVAVAIKVKEGDSVKLQGTGLAVEEWFKGEAQWDYATNAKKAGADAKKTTAAHAFA